MSEPLNVSIVMPVYNDWHAAEAMCRALDREFLNLNEHFQIILVDDGSDEHPARQIPVRPLSSTTSVGILELTRNVGHQRAIAIALAYIHDCVKTDAVLVMDADGEDRAEDVPRLIEALKATGGERAVFATRGKRLERLTFRLGYQAYRRLHRILTGFKVQVGNFSVIPAKYLAGLVVSPELWAHYAAAVVNSRIPVHLVPADRGRRISGRSSMNYVLLVTHGLSALSVFRDRVGARLLIAAAALCGLLTTVLLAIAVFGIGSGSRIAPPIWGTLILLIVQIGIAGFIFAFVVFTNRQDLGCVPIRDYKHFVRGFKRADEQRSLPVSGR